MSTLLTHGPDWCHVCGRRVRWLCDVYFPENAEHDRDCTRYLRVCAGCASAIEGVALAEPAISLQTYHPRRVKHRPVGESSALLATDWDAIAPLGLVQLDQIKTMASRLAASPCDRDRKESGLIAMLVRDAELRVARLRGA